MRMIDKGGAPGTSTHTSWTGVGIRVALGSLAIAAVAPGLNAGILDFESLPEPTYYTGQTVHFDPLEFYMGFRFSSVNYIPPHHTQPELANVWFDYTLGPVPNYDFGYPFGINGDRALGTPFYHPMYPATYSVERQDGGEWMFGGAQVCSLYFYETDGSPFRVVGWRDGVEVYNITTELVPAEQLFFGAQVSSIAVDKVVMTYRVFYSDGTENHRPFLLDDMHYELVPAPGALALLSMCGLLRRRQRD